MVAKYLKRLAEILEKSEGISLLAIIVLMVVMSVMGGVFSTIMGRWKLSAPAVINSSKAFYLAETAAMYALHDASFRFYGGSFNYGTSGSPYIVYSSGTETSYYWFERPDSGYENDDVTTGTDDDNVDDDTDDASNPTRYSIIATGAVMRDGNTVAKRQIKIKADITDNSSSPVVVPGVHTDGSIIGTGANQDHFDINNSATGAYVTYAKTPDVVTSGSETGIVYRPSATLNEDVFKALAADQGHYNSGNLSPGDGYPNGSFYYSGSVPNITYVGGDFTVNGNLTIYGIFWVKGTTSVFNGNYQLNGIIISEGDITMNGGGNKIPNLNGGIIQYGVSNTLTGNGNPVDIDINSDYFDDVNSILPNITIVSWQEAVSAN